MDNDFGAEGDLRAGGWGLFARSAVADDLHIKADGRCGFNYLAYGQADERRNRELFAVVDREHLRCGSLLDE